MPTDSSVQLDLKLARRVLDCLIGLTGWLSEMGYEEKLPEDLDNELANLMDDMEKLLEEIDAVGI